MAADDIRQFVASNHSVEIKLDIVDEAFILRNMTMMKQIEKDFDVKAYLNKTRQSVTFRGREKNTKSAENELKKILYGGEGFGVEKLFVPNNILGAIIGKGGQNITKYEKDYESVMVNIHSLTRCLSIRGPTDKVEACKRSIMKDMMKCKISESIQIDENNYDKLSENGLLSKIIGSLPVTFTLLKESLRLKGAFNDVQEVIMLVTESLTGVYTTTINLIPDIFRNVQSTIQDIEIIGDETSTSVTLDKNMVAIQIQGKRSNAKRAKIMLIDFLEKMSPNLIIRVKFLKPLLPYIGSTKDVADLLMKSGCDLSLERDICTFILQSSSRDRLSGGILIVEQAITSCMKLIYVVQVESWLMKYMQTNKMTEIESIKTQCGCDIVLSSGDFTVSVIAKEEQKVSNARVLIDAIIDRAKTENKFIDLPESSIIEFVGPSGNQMAIFASSFGVNIERVKKSKSRIFVQGDETSVARTLVAIEDWVSKWKTNNGGMKVVLENSAITHLDKKSAIIGDIERKFGVKVDVNRNKQTATISGGKFDNQEEASIKLESALMDVFKQGEIKFTNKENELKRVSANTNIMSYSEMNESPITEFEAKISNKVRKRTLNI